MRKASDDAALRHQAADARACTAQTTQSCVIKNEIMMTGHQSLLKNEINAVLFDAFGTLCEIRDKRQPFGKLARFFPDRERSRTALMTRPVSLRDAASQLPVDSLEVLSLEEDLRTELESIVLYPEVADMLETLAIKGMKLAIVSNLALPYAAPLLRLLPLPFDAYAWSFNVGALKPDRRIFSWACDALAVAPENCLMVGDSYKADYCGAKNFGVRALHLVRATSGQHLPDTISDLACLKSIIDDGDLYAS